MITVLIVMTGVMAGIYFAFSVFIMKSLAGLPPVDGARAMNKINDVIINTVFLPLFFGSTIWYGGLIVWSIAHWGNSEPLLRIIAAVIYILGMFVVTAFGNVPLNNRLKNSEVDETTLARVWLQYLRQWTLLNHVRTVSCIVACAILVASNI